MEIVKKARVLVLGYLDNNSKFDRVTSYDDVTDIEINDHQTILYRKHMWEKK